MKTGEELRTEWRASQPIRGDWDKVLRGKAFAAAATLVITEASEAAEAHPLAEDSILARGLAFQRGVRFAIQRMRGLTAPEHIPKPEPEPYGHIKPDYFINKQLED